MLTIPCFISLLFPPQYGVDLMGIRFHIGNNLIMLFL
jgi:hypothetical protein